MHKGRFTEEQIVELLKLKEHAAGMSALAHRHARELGHIMESRGSATMAPSSPR
jgi:hypothetical protein